MNKTRSYMTATALACSTAAAALLVGLSGAQAQAPAPGPPLSGAGSFPGSFIVPGTNTSLHVGGVVQMDMYYNINRADGSTSPSGSDNEYPAATSVEGAGVTANSSTAGNQAGHTLRMQDISTRPNIETRTPTAYGELKTYIELDFAYTQTINSSGSQPGATATFPFGSEYSAARVKQAYGTLGPWLFGLTNSNYADLDAWNDTINGGGDAGGMMGNPVLKETQIRYTYLLPNGISEAASIENYESGGIISTNTSGLSAAAAWPAIPASPSLTFNDFNGPGIGMRIPAFVNALRMDQPWGHVAWHLAVAQTRVQFVATAANAEPLGGFPALGAGGTHISRWGYQTNITGHFNTIGSDKITWQATIGQGADEFSDAFAELGSQWIENLVCSINASATGYTCGQPREWGVTAGYSHFWTPEWRSGVAFGYDKEYDPSSAGAFSHNIAGNQASILGVLERAHYSSEVNLLWSPIPAAQFGIEYEWYRRIVQSGASGNHQRIESQAIFKF